MSTYIIGDVHGCLSELKELFDKIEFDSTKDTAVFVGDLINRGPDSLGVLRFVKELGDSAKMVLGNHDISLIAYAAGVFDEKKSSYQEILNAKDGPELVDWVRSQPLLIEFKRYNAVVVHAAIPPVWTIKKATRKARKAEKKMAGKKYAKYLKSAYSNGENDWNNCTSKLEKFRYTLNGMTMLRYCHKNGELNFSDKSSLGKQQKGLFPWFELRKKIQRKKDKKIFFGHWAALGFYQTDDVVCIDSGCVWGEKLTAIKLGKKTLNKIQVKRK